MEGKEKRSRKDLIKNIAIVFLAIMLALTFFSNTIMNYSLPEVATKYIEPGNIMAKVRGTGIVTVNDPYKISIKESRTIASVAVKAGDTVVKDQVLFYLEDSDSEELNKAEQELDDLILSYTTALLKGDISNQSFQNIQNGNISSVTGYQARIEAARQKVKNAQANVDSLTRQVAIAGGSGNVEDLTVAMKKAQAAMATAQETMSLRQTELSEKTNQRTVLLNKGNLEDNLQLALNDENIAKNDLYEKIKDTVLTDGSKFGAIYKNGVPSDAEDYAFSGKAETQAALSQAVEKQTEADVTYNSVPTAQSLYHSYLAAKGKKETAQSDLSEKATLDEAVRNAESEYNKAKNYYNECKTYYDNLSNKDAQNTVDNSKLKEQLQLQLSDAEAALKKAQEEQTQLLTDVGQELNLSSQNSIIADKQKEIAKLRENAVGATVVAPMDGTVISVSKIAGEDTVPEEALATMVATGKGFTVSFSVTNEQAKRATVGEQAEIQNSWYYGDLKATLQIIRPDKENPAQKKELTFSVEGEVQDGQSLSLSVGQKSSNYDMLVPNSAIKEDNTGKFILIIEVKNSPLGNRYRARRVDVEVLASDDTQTAIIGDVNSYEYVITTSTKPIAAGDLVRISDN